MSATPPTRPSGGGARDRLRRSSMSLLRHSRVGAGSAQLAIRLPRRETRDEPSPVQIRPFRGHRLAILAHFDASGSVDDSFRHLGRTLVGEGYEVVVCTTSPTNPAQFAALVDDFAIAVIVRGNEGYDFQSWRRGIELARRSQWSFDRLILTNGSMHGPLTALDGILSTMDRHSSWGMTESLDLRPHVQSWWLAFGDGVLTHPEFDRYWSRVRPAKNKWETILAHELRWSQDLALDGPTAAYVPVAAHQCRRNPLFFAWRELISDWHMPFFKRSLLGPNYDRIDMHGWRDFIHDQAPSFDLELVSP
ncbi:MAG: rhamnan synthesis F family protein [Candidatus Nanopelagicales bacterium]